MRALVLEFLEFVSSFCTSGSLQDLGVEVLASRTFGAHQPREQKLFLLTLSPAHLSPISPHPKRCLDDALRTGLEMHPA